VIGPGRIWSRDGDVSALAVGAGKFLDATEIDRLLDLGVDGAMPDLAGLAAAVARCAGR